MANPYDVRRAKSGDKMLVMVDLRRVDLSRVDLSRVDLSGATLTEADLSGADLSGAKYNDDTHWPEGFTPPPNAVKKD